MSFIGSALGAGYQSDYTPDTQGQINQLINPVTKDQAAQGLAQQQNFVNALQAQNGIGNQNAAFQQYQNMANGTGPNVAQAQLAQATQQNVANQAAMAAGQRGASQNVGMMARGAANQGMNAQQQSAGQAATLGAQQQVQGIQGMANIAGQQVTNQGGAIQNLNQNQLGMVGNYNSSLGQLYGSENTSDTAIQLQNDKNKSGLMGGLLSGAGGILSDERTKKDVKPADAKIKDFLDKAGAHEYKYKDPGQPGAAPGKHVGPMAQELEKSELGSQMVGQSPDGTKSVDFQRGLGTLVSALASLNKRIDQMEGGKKAKMADGGVAGQPPKDQFGLPQFGKAMQMNMNQGAGPQEAEQKLQNGASDLTNALGQKYVKPYVDSAKQSISDYFTGNGLKAGNGGNSASLGADTNLSGGPMAPSMQGPHLDAFGSPMPQTGGPSLGANMDFASAAPVDAPASTGLESLGGESAGEAAGAEAAGSDAAAAEGAATAGEAAGAAEAAEGGSAVADLALLANKGTKAKKKVPALVSPGEGHIPAHKVADVASGRKTVAQAARIIPGKAKVAGDSLKNDTVDKTLNKGDVIVPRTKMKDPHDAASFVQALMFKHHPKGKK